MLSMKTARYNYRFYPTPTQEVELAKLFGCVRVVFNWGLESGFEALAREQNVPSMATLSGLLTKMKKTEQYAWLNEVSCVPLQQSLRHLSRAWNNCWSKRAKRPRFKSRRDKQSAEFTRSAMKVNAQVVTLAKISGPLELRWSRSLPSHPTSCTVTKDKAGRYHISFVVEHKPAPAPVTTKQIGVEIGRAHV